MGLGGTNAGRLLTGAVVIALAALGCDRPERDWVLPDPAGTAQWFGEGADVSFDGNLLEIRGTIDPDFLRRGGRIWARSGPYFYLFNVHVQQLLQDYPDIAAVRATTFTEEGEELATATLHRDDFTESRWREAVARASLAQQQGTENPRVVERLIQFGEDHTRFSYSQLAR